MTIGELHDDGTLVIYEPQEITMALAAHDMLEALKAAYTYIDTKVAATHENAGLLGKLTAAITKAERKEQ